MSNTNEHATEVSTINYKPLKITYGNKERDFVVTLHFLARMKQRFGVDCDFHELKNMLLGSFYIPERPKTVSHMFNPKYFYEKSFYLWNKPNKLVFVIVEHKQDKIINVLKTTYDAVECGWLTMWQNRTPVDNRKKFYEVFTDDKIFKDLIY